MKILDRIQQLKEDERVVAITSVEPFYCEISRCVLVRIEYLRKRGGNIFQMWEWYVVKNADIENYLNVDGAIPINIKEEKKLRRIKIVGGRFRW